MALAHAARLVTHNTRDRENIPELCLESWLTSDAESR
jgi:predicted nucleic acid-binding protein